MKIARQYNIPTYTHYEKLITRDALDVIIDVTRNPWYTSISKKQTCKYRDTWRIRRQTHRNLVEERKKKEEEIQKVFPNRRRFYHIGNMLSSATDMNDVFQTIVRSGLEITNTLRGSLALYDEEKTNWNLQPYMVLALSFL